MSVGLNKEVQLLYGNAVELCELLLRQIDNYDMLAVLLILCWIGITLVYIMSAVTAMLLLFLRH